MITNKKQQEPRDCDECADVFTPDRAGQRFCCAEHRKAWMNRRAVRGAELYDAFMSLRYDRGWARTVGLWQLICRLASEWRAADQRAGRRSHQRCDRWLELNRTSLQCEQLGNVNTGRRAA